MKLEHNLPISPEVRAQCPCHLQMEKYCLQLVSSVLIQAWSRGIFNGAPSTWIKQDKTWIKQELFQVRTARRQYFSGSLSLSLIYPSCCEDKMGEAGFMVQISATRWQQHDILLLPFKGCKCYRVLVYFWQRFMGVFHSNKLLVCPLKGHSDCAMPTMNHSHHPNRLDCGIHPPLQALPHQNTILLKAKIQSVHIQFPQFLCTAFPSVPGP